MCTVAPRAAAAPGFGNTAELLDRRHGVVAAAVAPAAMTSGHNAGEPTTRRARASEASAPPARKRGRHDDGFQHVAVVVDPAAASSALRVRMDKELVSLQGLIKRAKLLPSAPTAEKKCAAVVSPPPAASKRRASPSKPATEAGRAPAKQQRPVMQCAPAKNPIAPEVPNKQRPAEAPAAEKQQHPVERAAAAAAKTTEVPKKRRPEEEEKEPARTILVWNSATTREEFRQMLLDMEKSAMPDETIYPEELEALGIPFEFVVTRTWKQAMEDHAKKKVKLVGV